MSRVPVPVPTNIAHKLEWLKVKELGIIYPSAQRPLSMGRAKEIADGFDPDSFGTLIVCTTAVNAIYHVIDGWTRTNGIKLLFGNEERVPCANVGFKTEEEAAQIFAQVNGGRSKPTPIEMFNVLVTAGVPLYVEVDAILKSRGLHVDQSNSSGSLRCAGALTTIYSHYGADGLRNTLSFVDQVWGKDRAAYDAQVIRGSAEFLHNNNMDTTKVLPRVIKKYTPGRLVAGARATRDAFGGSVTNAVAKLLREAAGALATPIDTKARRAK